VTDKRAWIVAAVIAVSGGVVGGDVETVSASTRAGCQVAYDHVAQWERGFIAGLQVRNTSSSTVRDWSMSWTFPDDQRVVYGWSGTFTQNSSTVAVRATDWNRVMAPDDTVRIGFLATHLGRDSRPVSFQVNGVACEVFDEQESSGRALGAGRIQYGPVYTGEGTFYGATGEGNCSYEATSDRMIAAMNETDYQNSQACGAHVDVTGPTGKQVTVKIVDRCPKCRPGDIDLSKEAFAELAASSTGRIKISWRLLSPALPGPVAYKYKDGSSQHWCAIQVRNHRNPVRSVEVLIDGRWKSLPRQMDNYFLSSDGKGCGGTLRVTDIYDHKLIDSGKAVLPGVVQPGRSQFELPS
jgi:expansin (peptidoglycan-binding protein)